MGRLRRVVVAGLAAGVLTSGVVGEVLVAEPAKAAAQTTAVAKTKGGHGHHCKSTMRRCKARAPR
jgi:hypothetical protein